MPDVSPRRPFVLVVVHPEGISSVHFSASDWQQERAALALYDRLRPTIDLLDVQARH